MGLTLPFHREMCSPDSPLWVGLSHMASPTITRSHPSRGKILRYAQDDNIVGICAVRRCKIREAKDLCATSKPYAIALLCGEGVDKVVGRDSDHDSAQTKALICIR